MEEIFKNIDIGKRNRIINSALEEFGKNPYDKASTNNIVKNANISKGLLYHYFDSKKKLYEYLIDFVINTIISEINEKIDLTESDILMRIKQVVLIKMEIGNSYPYIFDFAKSLLENASIDELKKRSEEFSGELLYKVYSYNIDFSKFRNDIDVTKALNIIRWTIEKYGEETYQMLGISEKEIDFHLLEKEIDQYIEVLRKVLYK